MGFLKVKTTTRADRISNFQMTCCDFGTPVPDLCGTIKISPNVINWKDFYSQEIKTTTKSGKSKSTSYSYKYYVYLELALGEGVSELGACWVGDTKYNSLSVANNTKDAQGFPLTFNSSGTKSSYMNSKYPSQAVDYDGLAYLHSPGGGTSGSYLGENSASVPSYAFEVKGQLRNTGDGIDVNPADFILHILKKIGVWSGSGSEENMVSGIGNFRNYCAANNLLISSPSETSQRKGQDIIKDICDLFDVYFFWSNNKFKIAIKDHTKTGNWNPNKTVIYDLTPDDMLEQADGAIVSFSRKDSSEIYNRFTVEFNNRANDYETETISLELPESIRETGLRQQSTISAPYVYTKNRAIKLAQIASRKNQRERNKYTIKLDWAYALLEPGDLITLTDPVIGLEKQIAMVDSVVENKDGTIQVDLLQYVDGDYEAGVIDMEDDVYNLVDYNIEPSPTAAPIIFQPPTAATSSGNPELWIAIKGEDPETWGGCNLMIANQDSNYQYMGQFQKVSSYGKLTQRLLSNEVTFTANINGDFENATKLDALHGNSLFWVNGECMSYETATKKADGSWTFGNLHRGQFYTDAVNHEIGEDVVFCDGSLFSMNLTSSMFGRQLFFKFPSMNVFGSNSEDETDAETYAYRIAAPSSIDTSGVSVRPHVAMNELTGELEYFIVVDWIPPSVSSYIHSAVYYHTPTDSPQWTFGGYGTSTITVGPLDAGYNYGVCICPVDIHEGATQPSISSQVEVYVPISESSIIPPSGFNVTADTNNNDFLLTWFHADSAFGNPAAYYEVSYEKDGITHTIRTSDNNCRVPIFWPKEGDATFTLVAHYKDGTVSAPIYDVFHYYINHISHLDVITTITEDGNSYRIEWTPPSSNIGNVVDYYELSYVSNGETKIETINRHSNICQVPIFVTNVYGPTGDTTPKPNDSSIYSSFTLTTYYINGLNEVCNFTGGTQFTGSSPLAVNINVEEDVLEVSWTPPIFDAGNFLESCTVEYSPYYSEDKPSEVQVPKDISSCVIPIYVEEGRRDISIDLSFNYKGGITEWRDEWRSQYLFTNDSTSPKSLSVTLNDVKDSFIFRWKQNIPDLLFMVDHWELSYTDLDGQDCIISIPRADVTVDGDVFEYKYPFFYNGEYSPNNANSITFRIYAYYRNGEQSAISTNTTATFYYEVQPPTNIDIYFTGYAFGVGWTNSENPMFENGIVKPFKNYRLEIENLGINEIIPIDYSAPYEVKIPWGTTLASTTANFYVTSPNGTETKLFYKDFLFEVVRPTNIILELVDRENYKLTWEPPALSYSNGVSKYTLECNYADAFYEIDGRASDFNFPIPPAVYDKYNKGWTLRTYFTTGKTISETVKTKDGYTATFDSAPMSAYYNGDLVINWDSPTTNQINTVYAWRLIGRCEKKGYQRVYEINDPDARQFVVDSLEPYETYVSFSSKPIQAAPFNKWFLECYICGETLPTDVGSIDVASKYSINASSSAVTYNKYSDNVWKIFIKWPLNAESAEIYTIENIDSGAETKYYVTKVVPGSDLENGIPVTFRSSGSAKIQVIFRNDFYFDYWESDIVSPKLLIKTADIANLAVTEDKIWPKSITSSKMANNAVTTSAIEDEAVTGDKLADVIEKESIVFDTEVLQRVHNEDGTYKDVPLLSSLDVSAGITYCGTANDGQVITFGKEFDSVPTVICLPVEVPINSSYPNADISCGATYKTTKGFTMYCKRRTDSGQVVAAGIGAFFVIAPGSSLNDYTKS